MLVFDPVLVFDSHWFLTLSLRITYSLAFSPGMGDLDEEVLGNVTQFLHTIRQCPRDQVVPKFVIFD